jgi:hypothetical protein
MTSLNPQLSAMRTQDELLPKIQGKMQDSSFIIENLGPFLDHVAGKLGKRNQTNTSHTSPSITTLCRESTICENHGERGHEKRECERAPDPDAAEDVENAKLQHAKIPVGIQQKPAQKHPATLLKTSEQMPNMKSAEEKKDVKQTMLPMDTSGKDRNESAVPPKGWGNDIGTLASSCDKQDFDKKQTIGPIPKQRKRPRPKRRKQMAENETQLSHRDRETQRKNKRLKSANHHVASKAKNILHLSPVPGLQHHIPKTYDCGHGMAYAQQNITVEHVEYQKMRADNQFNHQPAHRTAQPQYVIHAGDDTTCPYVHRQNTEASFFSAHGTDCVGTRAQTLDYGGSAFFQAKAVPISGKLSQDAVHVDTTRGGYNFSGVQQTVEATRAHYNHDVCAPATQHTDYRPGYDDRIVPIAADVPKQHNFAAPMYQHCVSYTGSDMHAYYASCNSPHSQVTQTVAAPHAKHNQDPIATQTRIAADDERANGFLRSEEATSTSSQQAQNAMSTPPQTQSEPISGEKQGESMSGTDRDDLMQTIEMLRERNSKLEEEVKSLKDEDSKLHFCTKRIDALQQERDMLQKRLKQNQNHASSHDKCKGKMDKLLHENSMLLQQLAGAREMASSGESGAKDNEKVLQQVSSLHAVVAAQKRLISEKETETQLILAKLAEVVKKLPNSANTHEKLLGQVGQPSSRGGADSVLKVLEFLCDNVSRRSSDAAELFAEKARLQAALDTETQRNSSLHDIIDAFDSWNGELTGEVQFLQCENKTVMADRDRALALVRGHMKSMTCTQQAPVKEMAVLQSKYDQLKNDLSRAERKIANRDEDIERLRNQETKITKENEQLKNDLSRAERKIANRDEDIERLRKLENKHVDKITKELEAAKIDMHAQDKKIESLHEKIKSLEVRNSALEKLWQAAESKTAELREECQVQKSTLSELQDDYNTVADRSREAQRLYEDECSRVRDLKARVQDLEDSESKSNRKRWDEHHRATQLAEDVKRLEAKMRDEEERNERSLKRIHAMQSEIQTLKEEDGKYFRYKSEYFKVLVENDKQKKDIKELSEEIKRCKHALENQPYDAQTVRDLTRQVKASEEDLKKTKVHIEELTHNLDDERSRYLDLEQAHRVEIEKLQGQVLKRKQKHSKMNERHLKTLKAKEKTIQSLEQELAVYKRTEQHAIGAASRHSGRCRHSEAGSSVENTCQDASLADASSTNPRCLCVSVSADTT